MDDFPSLPVTPVGAARMAQAKPGELTLQHCNGCDRFQYPSRALCARCLSGDLDWRQLPGNGRVVAAVVVHAAMHAWFRAHVPWRICLVELEAGPRVLAEAADARIEAGRRVRVADRFVGEAQTVLSATLEDEEEQGET